MLNKKADIADYFKAIKYDKQPIDHYDNKHLVSQKDWRESSSDFPKYTSRLREHKLTSLLVNNGWFNRNSSQADLDEARHMLKHKYTNNEIMDYLNKERGDAHYKKEAFEKGFNSRAFELGYTTKQANDLLNHLINPVMQAYDKIPSLDTIKNNVLSNTTVKSLIPAHPQAPQFNPDPLSKFAPAIHNYGK